MKQTSRKANIKWTDRGKEETKRLINWFSIVGDEQDLIDKYEWIKKEVEEGRINRRNPQDIILETQSQIKSYRNLKACAKVMFASREYWRILAKVLGESNVSHKSANTRTKQGVEDEQLGFDEQIKEIDRNE